MPMILGTMEKSKLIIQTRYNFIRLAITQGEVILQHISPGKMVANPLTKAIARDAFQAYVRNLRLCKI